MNKKYVGPTLDQILKKEGLLKQVENRVMKEMISKLLFLTKKEIKQQSNIKIKLNKTKIVMMVMDNLTIN